MSAERPEREGDLTNSYLKLPVVVSLVIGVAGVLGGHYAQKAAVDGKADSKEVAELRATVSELKLRNELDTMKRLAAVEATLQTTLPQMKAQLDETNELVKGLVRKLGVAPAQRRTESDD